MIFLSRHDKISLSASAFKSFKHKQRGLSWAELLTKNSLAAVFRLEEQKVQLDLREILRITFTESQSVRFDQNYQYQVYPSVCWAIFAIWVLIEEGKFPVMTKVFPTDIPVLKSLLPAWLPDVISRSHVNVITIPDIVARQLYTCDWQILMILLPPRQPGKQI